MKLSIFGPRGCGKTTYLTCLYGAGTFSSDFAIIARDEHTQSHLKSRWEALWAGQDTLPTPLSIIDLHLKFAAKDMQYDIDLQDFSGGLVMNSQSNDAVKIKYRDQLFDHVKTSDAIMIFLEAQEPSIIAKEVGASSTQEIAFERKAEIERLIAVLGSQERRDLISKPIALVVTKWDLAALTYGNNEQAASNFIKEHYPGVLGILKNFSSNIRIFYCSSFGFTAKSQSGNLIPGQIHPFKLEDPFVWIAEKIDEVGYQGCETLEKEDSKEYSMLIAQYKKFVSKINRGPWYEKALQRLAYWKDQQRKKRMAVGSIGVLLFLMLGVLGSFSYESWRYNRVSLALEEKNGMREPNYAIQLAQDYLSQFHFGFHWKPKIEKQKSELEDKLEKQEFADITALYNDRMNVQDIPGMESRVQKYKTFCSKYPSHKSIPQINIWIAQEEKELRYKLAQRDYDDLNREYQTLNNNQKQIQDWLKKANEFVVQYPNFQQSQDVKQKIEQAIGKEYECLVASFPKDAETIKLVDDWQKKLEKFQNDHPCFPRMAELTEQPKKAQDTKKLIIDKQEYNHLIGKLKNIQETYKYVQEINNFLQDHPATSFKEFLEKVIQQKDDQVFEAAKKKADQETTLAGKIKAYQEYLQYLKEYTRHIQDAEHAITAQEDAWYQKIKAMNNDIAQLDVNKLEQLELWVNEYMQSSIRKTHIPALQAWLKWYENCKQGIEFSVVIKEAKLIEECKALFNWVTAPDTAVSIQYGKIEVSTTTQENTDWNPQYNHTVTIPWKLSNSTPLTVALTCYDGPNKTLSWTSKDGFLPKYIHSAIPIQCDDENKHNHKVVLQCSKPWYILP